MKIRLLILLLALAATANAQESVMPALGDHRFVPATRIEDPFINGYIQTSVALGRAINTDTPTYILPDSTVVTVSGSEQVFIGLSLHISAPDEELARRHGQCRARQDVSARIHQPWSRKASRATSDMNWDGRSGRSRPDPSC